MLAPIPIAAVLISRHRFSPLTFDTPDADTGAVDSRLG